MIERYGLTDHFHVVWRHRHSSEATTAWACLRPLSSLYDDGALDDDTHLGQDEIRLELGVLVSAGRPGCWHGREKLCQLARTKSHNTISFFVW